MRFTSLSGNAVVLVLAATWIGVLVILAVRSKSDLETIVVIPSEMRIHDSETGIAEFKTVSVTVINRGSRPITIIGSSDGCYLTGECFRTDSIMPVSVASGESQVHVFSYKISARMRQAVQYELYVETGDNTVTMPVLLRW